MSDAEQWKQAGNAAYKAGDYVTAISNYTSAIAADRSDAKPYVNRSIAHAALLNWKDSAHDARCAIQLDPKYTKAHFRFVKALLALEKYRDARTALSLAFKECGEQVKELKELENEILTLTGVPLRPKSTDFEVIGELGDGNFSKVYKTYLKSTRQVFAIKAIERVVIDRMKRRHPNINNEILMEKKNLHKLNHPGIATLYATFQDAGTLYFMNEYIGGGDLWTNLHEIIYEKVAAVTGSINLSEADFLDAQSVRKGVTGAQLGLHWSQLRWYFAQMISAVEHMHRRGVVHRDIKPENIMITEQGYLKFVDFGTSKDLIDTELNGPEFVGTPEYMSPGTVKVKGHARVGIEADLWALGVTLFQMALGYTTFAAPSPFLTFLRIKRGKVMIPSWVPVPLAALIRLLLTKDDAERVQLASDGTASPKLLGYPSAAAAVRNAEKVAADDAQTLCYDALRRHSFFTQWAEVVTLPNVLAYRQSLRQRANLPATAATAAAAADDDNAVATLTTAYRTVQAASDPFTRLSSVQHIFTHMQTLRTTALGEDTEHLRMVVTATRDRTNNDATATAATNDDDDDDEHVPPPCRVPSLHDLCLRAVADAAVTVAYACAANGGVRPVATHPWMQRFHLATPQPLSHVDRQRIMHILDRQQKLQIPSVYRLFFSSLPEARCQRANVDTREVVGLNRSLQGHYNKPFQFAYVTNPRIGQSYAAGDAATATATAEEDAGEVQLRQTIAALNKLRPRLVVIAGDLLAPTVSTTITTATAVVRKGYLDRLRKLLARVSDTIAVLLVPSPSDVGVHVDDVTATVSQWDTQRLTEYRHQFGAEYYGFWFEGMRGLVLNSSLFFSPAADSMTMHPSDRVAWAAAQRQQLQWLEEELEQAKLCATSIVLFTYHRWYVHDVDEDHEANDSGSGSGSGGVCIPKAVRLQVLAWARHHKVRFVCSAAAVTSTVPAITRPFATQARAYRIAEQQREDEERRQQAAADAAAEAAAAAAEPVAVESVDVRVDESSAAANATATAGTTSDSDSDSDEEGDGKATATAAAAEEEKDDDDDDRYFNEEAQYDGPQMLLATEASTAVRMVYVTEDDTVVRDGLVDVAAAMAAAAAAAV